MKFYTLQTPFEVFKERISETDSGDEKTCILISYYLTLNNFQFSFIFTLQEPLSGLCQNDPRNGFGNSKTIWELFSQFFFQNGLISGFQTLSQILIYPKKKNKKGLRNFFTIERDSPHDEYSFFSNYAKIKSLIT